MCMRSLAVERKPVRQKLGPFVTTNRRSAPTRAGSLLLALLVCSITPSAFGAEKQSKAEKQYKLELVKEVQVTEAVYAGLKKSEIFSKLLVFDNKLTVKASKNFQVFFVQDTKEYVIFTKDKQSEQGEDPPIMMRSESTEKKAEGSVAWRYYSCSCGGFYMAPGQAYTNEGGDFCAFIRENGQRTLECGGSCDGTCERRWYGVTASGIPYNFIA